MHIKLHWQIAIALVLAVIAGLLSGTDSTLFGLRFYDIFTFIGTLFLNALRMLIVPLVVSSMIVGVAAIGNGKALGRLGGKTVTYYLLTSLFAILIGLMLANVIDPGLADGQPVGTSLGLDDGSAAVQEKLQGRGGSDVAEVFLRMIPPNIVAAAAEGQMLGLIFFSLLFGYFLLRIPPDSKQPVFGFFQGVYEVMLEITHWVMKFSPLGVFALVAQVVASTGFEVFRPLLWFFLTVVLALAVHFFVVLPVLLKVVGRVSPWRHYQAMMPALLTAFSTSSSSATLPLTMECVEKNAGVSNRTSSFVLPLGATVNMDGTALYECVAVLFIAQAYGVSLGLAEQLLVVLLALVTSIGVAGIPAASLVAIAVILAAVGLPAEAIGLILVVDRVLDMCRTTVNVFSDSCGAVIIARTEGEQDILTGNKP